MADVIMPKMSDAMTEGKVLAWRKRVGEPVRRGEAIAEIETDKVNVEIDAEADGTLADIVVPEGATAPVGSVIAHINGAQAGTQPSGSQGPRPHPDNVATPPKPEPAPPQPAALSRPRPAVPSHDGEPLKASPLARRLAAERGVDLAAVTGTGPGGRIVERDVLAYAERAPAEAPVEAPPPPAAPAATPSAAADYEDVELSRMRQAIALSVARSMQVTPHFYVTGEVDMGRALELRAQLKEAYGEPDGHVTINDLVLKAAALALRRHPDLNAQFIEPKSLRRFHRIHLGIMVAIPNGLVVPVLRDADTLPLLKVAREARRLIEGAQRQQLKYEDYTGATFSVSNLGGYPVSHFTAIINAPQAGIVAVGRVEERPVIRDGQVAGRPMMSLTLSADHRVTDGVGAAALLAEIKRLLENPVLLVAGE